MRLYFLSLLASIFFLLFVLPVSAHPGNVSSDGCHYCWTRCQYWGFTYGMRHNPYNLGATCSCNPPVDPLYCHPQTTTSASDANTNSFTDTPTPSLFQSDSPTATPILPLVTNEQSDEGVMSKILDTIGAFFKWLL